MDPKYEPKTREEKIGWLTEECGEVLKAIGKIQRFGMDSVHPDDIMRDKETNREHLEFELKDLKAAIELVEIDLRTLESG